MSNTIQRTKAQAVFFLLGAVLVGGALGFTANRAIAHRETATDQKSSRAQLAERMQLSPEQRHMLDSVLDLRNARLKAILAPVRPQMDSVRLEARAAIRGRLSAAQQAQWDQIIAEMSKDSSRSD